MASIVILYKKINLLKTILESTTELIERFGSDAELDQILNSTKKKYAECLVDIETQKNQYSSIEDLDN